MTTNAHPKWVMLCCCMVLVGSPCRIWQVGPGCISVSLSNAERYPFFTRMAPSFRFNVLSIYEMLRFLGLRRVGIVYGYRSINILAKDLFLALMQKDVDDGSYSWTPLYSKQVQVLDDAKAAVELVSDRDARINFMALYEVEGSMLLCQAYQRQIMAPSFLWLAAAGWWNRNYITLNAGTVTCPCTAQELHRASYAMIASDRGPMLNTEDVHGLSGVKLADLYRDYTEECESFANGKGVCNHQWAGYFYDGIWLIASILHQYLGSGNRSVSDLATEQSRQALFDLSIRSDFLGQTGRVRQFNGVDVVTTPPSLGDRDGIVLLRQVTSNPEDAFIQLAFRTSQGLSFKSNISWSPTDATKMLFCQGSACDFEQGWIPADFYNDCEAGEFWSSDLGCSHCAPGFFSPPQSTECQECIEGTYSNASGAASCSQCEPGKYSWLRKATFCFDCWEGNFMNHSGATDCYKCPLNTFATAKGHELCEPCPRGRQTEFEGASAEEMCKCPNGQRVSDGVCVECKGSEICQGGVLLGFRPARYEWITSLDAAGSQRARVQLISKLFLLIAANIEPEESMSKLLLALDAASQSLHNALNGNSSLGVISPPDAEVQTDLESYGSHLGAFRTLLLGGLEQIRTEGAASMDKLQAVKESTDTIAAAAQKVVDSLTKAATSSGEEVNGVVQDIAGRQRALIQKMCKEALLVSFGVSLTETWAAFQNTISVFEHSHEGLIFGIEAVGIPALTQMCTMQQMREVSYYFSRMLQFLRLITNAQSNSESQQVAQSVVRNISSLADPFFDAMVLAVQLYVNDTGECNPLATTTRGEWWHLLVGIADFRIGLLSAVRLYMQVANRMAGQLSQVELASILPRETELGKSLMQGDKSGALPAPPTPELLNVFVATKDQWGSLSTLMVEAVEGEDLPEVNVHRVLLLGDQLLGDFNEAMKLTIEAAELAGISFQSRILDLTHRQQMRFPQIVSQALTIFFRDPDRSGWVELNATILQFRSLHSKLLLGGFPEEEHLHSSNFTLRKVGDVCIVRQMARIMVYYDEMEQLVYQVAHATLEPSGLQRLLELNVLGMDAMEVCSHELEKYYDGEHHGCDNQSLAVDEWLVLIEEVAGLTGFGQDVVSELVLSQQTNPLVSRLDATIAQLTSSSQRILVGSARPLVPVQPTAGLFARVLDVESVVLALEEAAGAKDLSQALAQGEVLYTQTQDLLQTYVKEALKTDPSWPGKRVQVAAWQAVLAKKIFKQSMLSRFNIFTDEELRASMQKFQQNHQQLKNGGGGLEPLPSERQDLLDMWGKVDAAWNRFNASLSASQSEMDSALTELVELLEVDVRSFAIKDVLVEEVLPWSAYIAYCVPALIFLVCVCCGIYVFMEIRLRNAQKAESSVSGSVV
ncbi:unnamed protein product [Effrenium voratum]|nr:unnamed protein product [Effrenium voratum]